MATYLGRIVIGTVAVGSGVYVLSSLTNDENSVVHVQAASSKCQPKRPLPTREEQICSLQKDKFDVLIIGGGATGAGCALDAATRGLKTAMVEADDFACGTSSRSTKLIHGGVRYLQKAIMQADIEQYRMVKEALRERSNMLASAPHLTRPLPIMIPVYTWWQVPYYWIGIKMYDVVAGTKTLHNSYLLSKTRALEHFPMLKGDKLKGAIVYYDGQQDDARMNLAVALTATRYGATIANHVRVLSLHHCSDKGQKRVAGARVRDEMTGKEFDITAQCVINATGPLTDCIRKMDNPKVKEICAPSSGVHVVLPGYYSPDQMGLLDPQTSDGRVIFFLPWQKHTIAGTTDMPCELTASPKPTEEEIQFILTEIKHYLNCDVEVRRGDVLSAWCGIRPLVSDPNKEDTQSLARNHIVHVSENKLVTIAGGKWTTYREMAEQTIDTAIQACDLKPVHFKTQTWGLRVEGAHGWSPTMYIRLVQDFGLESEVAQNLANAYGDRAFSVAKLAQMTGKRWPIIGCKLHPEFPYIDAEIRYACQKEYAQSAVDVIARRLRIAFLNSEASQEALPGIVDIMAEELHWDEAEKKRQIEKANCFLQTEMGHMINKASREKAPINLDRDEVQIYVKRFQIIDKEKKGYISINDIRRSFKHSGEEVSGEQIHEILKEIDTNMNGQVELDEYLQMMSALKSGHVAYSRFARMAEMEEAHYEKIKKTISVERSGGGL